MRFESVYLTTALAIEVVFSLIAVALNILLLLSISKLKASKRRSNDIVIIQLLSILDFIYSTFSFFNSAIVLATKNKYFYNNSTLCWIESIIKYVYLLNNLSLLSLLSFLRYYIIVKEKKVKKKYIIIIIIVNFLINIILLVVNLVLSTPKLMPIQSYCLLRKKQTTLSAGIYVRFFNVFFIIKLFVFLFIIYYSYLSLIYYYYKKCHSILLSNLINYDNNSNNINGNSNSNINININNNNINNYISNNNLLYLNYNSHIKKTLIFIIVKAFIILLSYTLTVIPDLVTLIPYTLSKIKINPEIDLICSILRSLMPLFDAIFVLILHDDVFVSLKSMIFDVSSYNTSYYQIN
ncbi:hypothetical protein K502DRAFT_175432 [Neoconidiobolus thromboides FSU 785]|nr:hypothetical protein K502DRAFT_175432 [Neoconidiobolus thromboides FSU 785]